MGVKRSNPERKARVRGDHTYGPYHRWISAMPCLVAYMGGCVGKVKGHHLKTVAAGGRDYGNEVPLCVRHHGNAHSWGPSRFEDHFNVTLGIEAARAAALWKEHGDGPADA